MDFKVIVVFIFFFVIIYCFCGLILGLFFSYEESDVLGIFVLFRSFVVILCWIGLRVEFY